MTDDLQIESKSVSSRDIVMMMLQDGMDECHYKIKNGRIRDEEKERVRQGYLSELSSLANAWRRLEKDRSLAEMEDEIEELKSAEAYSYANS